MRTARSLTGLALLALAGCTELPLIEENVCGNRVVEPEADEDCDGQAGCGSPGLPNACRYTCSATDPLCPEAYRCGVDQVCRRHSGLFVPTTESSTVKTHEMLVGDLNADGCAEVLRFILRGNLVVTAFASHVSDHCPASEQILRPNRPEKGQQPIIEPHLTDLNDDGLLDLVVAGQGPLGAGLLVYPADIAPTLSPMLYPNRALAEPGVRTLAVRLLGAGAVLLIQGALPGPGPPTGGDGTVAAVLDPRLAPEELGVLPGGTGGIVALAAADLDGDGVSAGACDEVAIGRGSEPTLRLYRLCDTNGAKTFTPLPSPEVFLEAGVRLHERNASLVIADLNGDGHLDVAMKGNDGQAHAAYGLGDGRFHSSPPPPPGNPPLPGFPDQTTSVLPVSGEVPATLDFTLVAADFDATKPGAEARAVLCPPAPPLESQACNEVVGECEAVVADIDGDGDLDIVASEGQQADLILQRRIDNDMFQVSFLRTRCPPHRLTAGDIDGDGITDIAFFDQVAASADSAVTALSVVYGNAFAAPAPAVPLGRFPQAMDLAAFPFVPGEAGTQLLAAREAIGDEPGSALAPVEGLGDRLLVAPFYFPAPPGTKYAFSLTTLTVGRFGADGAAAVAVVTEDGKLRLVRRDETAGSLLDGSSGEGISPVCDDCVLAPVPMDGGERDRLLILGDRMVFVYEPSADNNAFEEKDHFPTQHAFRGAVAIIPGSLVPRPLVADLDGDGLPDVVARSTDGSLVALWGQADGRFEDTELVSAPGCPDQMGCGGLAMTLLNADADPGKEIAVIGPGRLALYELDAARRELVEIHGSNLDSPPDQDTDFAAIGAADFDGDGVDDLAVMRSSTFFTILRGVPVFE